MNRGFGFYFSNAIKSSARTLWHKGNMLKYFAWVIMELLSPFTFILGAMFSLANVRQAKIAERENTIDLPQSFKVACKAQPFWTMFLAIILEALIFLAGLILIGVASVLLGAIGYAVSLFVDYSVDPELIILIFFAPGMLVSLVYCIIMPILMAPTAYIIETNPDIGAADAISICFNTMKSRGKGTLFLNCFIPALIEGAIIGLGIAVEFVINLFVWDTQLSTVLAVIVGIIFFLAFALVAPMFALARKISNKNLYEDIVLDPVNAFKRTSGVNIKKCKGVKFDPAEYENELSLLFDETYSDRIPVPENPSLRKKRELEEIRAARAASAGYSKPVTEDRPVYTPVTAKPAADEEEDGELLTVSDLIGDVVAEEDATLAELPVQPEPAAEPEAEVKAEEPAVEPVAAEPAQPEPVAEPVQPEPQPEPVKEEKPVKEEPAATTAEPVAAEPVKKTTKTTATKTAATKTTATKATATKTATTKATATKASTTAAKPAATKTTAKTKTAEKSATSKSTTSKSTTSKSAAKKP